MGRTCKKALFLIINWFVFKQSITVHKVVKVSEKNQKNIDQHEGFISVLQLYISSYTNNKKKEAEIKNQQIIAIYLHKSRITGVTHTHYLETIAVVFLSKTH